MIALPSRLLLLNLLFGLEITHEAFIKLDASLYAFYVSWKIANVRTTLFIVTKVQVKVLF